MKTIKICLLLFCLSCLLSCGRVNVNNSVTSDRYNSNNTKSNLSETTTPETIKKLNQELEQYTPQVKIIAPSQNRVFNQANVKVELEVKDLPIFKDDKLNLGNHLDLILDNQPSRAIYDLERPITLDNLTPGTHTLRIFASRPWGESFKNDGAYAQATFSVLTETNDNRPDDNLPLLTYSSPTGSYNAEPILLDFYLTNAPLHSVAHQDSSLPDWRIKATVNGDSFFIENWQPIYLTGFNPGENWIQLELVDEAGNDIENTFNNTVRVIDYNPKQTNSLGKLVTNKIPLAQAESIVKQNYYIQPVGEPEIIEPTVEIEEAAKTETDKAVEEPTVEDRTETEIPEIGNENKVSEPSAIANPSSQESNLNLNTAINQEASSKEILPQPIVVSAPIDKEFEKKTTTSQDNLTENNKAVELTESEQIITINEENSDSLKPVAAIKIPQPESVEISEDEIAITIPEIEPEPAPKTENSAPVWWKKILVGVRQKLESLVKLLPNEV